MKVLLAHPGTQYSYHLAYQLEKNNLLYQFHTGFAFGKYSWLENLVNYFPVQLRKKVLNRFVSGVSNQRIKSHLIPELVFFVKRFFSTNSEQIISQRNHIFQQSISNACIQEADVIIGFDTSSWLLVERCKALGKQFILDVSIGHPLSKEKIYKELGQRYPLWVKHFIPKAQYLIDLECREIELANKIVVPSDFVRQTYLENGVPFAKIAINQFGTAVSEFHAMPKQVVSADRVRFLFFGSFTARKGLPLLLAAWSEMDTTHAELVLAGYGAIPLGVTLPVNVVNQGMIGRVQRQSLFDHAHVFVFPSNFEGLAQVQIEAAACGLPLIGTFNSGGGELIENYENGFLIDSEDKEALKKAMAYFIDRPEKISKMGKVSRYKAESFTWDAYGDRWKEILNLARA